MSRILLSLALLAAPLPLLADAPKAQDPFVVLVGAGTFDSPGIQPRPTAEADAKALHELFTSKEHFGVRKERALLLTAGATKPTRENILKALHEAVANTNKDDLIILGFFGRGASSGDGTAFFAADSTVADRGKNAVLGSDLAAELKNAKDRKILFLADVNYSVKGFDTGKETLIEPTLRDVLGAVFGTSEDRDEDPQVSDKLVVLCGFPANEPLIKDGNGLFAYSLVEALIGKADIEGYGPDGLVTADELVKYLETDVANIVRAAGKTTKEKETVPFIVGGGSSHFPITKNPAALPAAQKRLDALEALAKAGKLEKDVAVEGATLLARMPKLKVLQELRKAYEALADSGEAGMAKFVDARTLLKSQMVLTTAEATEFAKKTMQGIDMLQRRYIKKLVTGDLAANAVRGMYKYLEQPLPTDVEEQLKTAKEMNTEALRELLVQARLRLGKREDLDGVKDTDLALSTMMAALNDPYSIYLDAETKKKAESGMRSQFSGIGIHIRRDLARDGLLCVAPIKGSPAYKAGLKAGDLIVEVRREVDAEGNPLKADDQKVISTKGMKMDDALKIILGKPGVPVTVIVERDGTLLEPITINRGRVSLETVLGTQRDEKDNWKFWIDDENKIAYVYLTQFGPQTYNELKKVVEKCQADGMKGMILDLRHNPGGMLSAALMISDMFIESGVIVTVKPRVGRVETYEDEGFGNFTKFPMVVMVNGSSASASEIVSACLQDHKRAVVLGERSYGKGSVQTIEDFSPTMGQFKFTTARYFPKSEKNIDKVSSGGKPEDEWGVHPDKNFEYKLSREEKSDLGEFLNNKELLKKPEVKEGKPAFKDVQLEKALEHLRKELGVVAGAKP